jgi:hypothetical protein
VVKNFCADKDSFGFLFSKCRQMLCVDKAKTSAGFSRFVIYQKRLTLRYTEKKITMISFRNFFLLLFSCSVILIAPSCKSNKIPCPTYADSFPEKKAKKGKQEPQIPKPTKPKSGVLPPGYKVRKQRAD